MSNFNNPTQIFADDVQEEKGENARLSAFVGAIAVGDLVKSTLGPKGMDKILQSAYVQPLCRIGLRTLASIVCVLEETLLTNPGQRVK